MDTSGRPKRETASALDRARASPAVRERIKAYPGTVTYLDLIRRNKRASVLLIGAMILLGVAIGAVIGVTLAVAMGMYSAQDPLGTDRGPGSLLPSLLIGAVVALIVGSIGAVWSFYGGANAILRMTHARPVTREEDLELFNVVDEMRIAAGIPMPKVYLIPESALNAFATGRDPEHGVVAITTGLREKLTRDELQAVIAHEIAHIRHFDIRFAMLMATMVGLIVVACDVFLRASFYGGMRGGRRSSGGKGGGAAMLIMLAVALILAVIAPLFARIIQMSYSRQREFLADAGAVELTRNPEGLASALAKLAGDEQPQVETANRGTAHMFIVNPMRKMRASHQRLNTVFSSHPPIPDRVARILALTR